MPNTYANLGGTIGDILGRATGARTSSPQGYSAGVNAGSQHMLRSAQTGQSMADTDRIMYELDQARRGDQTSGRDIAQAMGVDPGAYDALSVPGATQMQVIPGDEGPSPVGMEQIPQVLRDKFTNANTLKVLQQLTGGTSAGGTADTMMAALLKGQDLGTMSNMQSGAQVPLDVATMKAAMEGKLPGTVGGDGGGTTASKVQEMNTLVQRNITLGMDKQQAHDAALLSIYGDPENEAWANAYQRAYQSTYSVASSIKSADAAVANMREKRSGNKAPGNVVKVYQ